MYSGGNPATGGGGINLAKWDFNDGTLGPFNDQGANEVTVIADPTGSGRGMVAKYPYAAVTSGVPQDSNLALFPTSAFTIGNAGSGATNGDTLWFQGDYYIDSQNDYLRKLVYFKSLSLQNAGHNSQTVHGHQPGSGVAGSQFIYSTWIDDFADNTSFLATKPFLQAWTTIKVHLKVNSAPGVADGIVQAWWNGSLEYSVTNAAWGGAGYPSTWVWDWFAIGEQCQASVSFSENRYWDNLSFATSESAL